MVLAGASECARGAEARECRVYGRGGAADLLGIRPTTLQSHLNALRINARARAIESCGGQASLGLADHQRIHTTFPAGWTTIRSALPDASSRCAGGCWESSRL